MIKRTTRMNTRVPMPMYTGSPFESSSIAGSRTGVLIREVRRRVVPRPARGHATTASLTQGAPPSTSLREPEPHSHDDDDDLDNGDQNPYQDFHVDPRLLVDRAYPRPRVEQTSCRSCASVREVRAGLSGEHVRERDHSGGDQPFRTHPKAERCRYLPSPRRPREVRRREATVFGPPAFSLRPDQSTVESQVTWAL
jgi:hypothetical protein